jgi:hypothetical protein
MKSAKTFLTKIDRSVGLADRDSASRYELPRRLEAIDFGTPPRKCSRHTGATRRQRICKVCVCDEMYCDCIIVSLQNCIIVPKYIVYSKCDERGKRRCLCPSFVSFIFCAVNVIFPRSNAASCRQHYPCVLLERSCPWTR